MNPRSQARRDALNIIFSAELRDLPFGEGIEAALESGDNELLAYAEELARGVSKHREELDGLISHFSRDWSLERMPGVDRNVLRIGVYELLHGDDVPPAVVMSEAVSMVREYSTDESPKFVNGVLGAIAKSVE